MLTFPCNTCGAPLTVNDDQRAALVTCTACNTRQPVPQNAAHVDSGSIPHTALTARAAVPPREPQYTLLGFVGALLIVVGAIDCLIALIAALDRRSSLLLLGILGGVATIGFGALLLYIREIAINVWHIRHAKQHTAPTT
jgi:hypothetical protein